MNKHTSKASGLILILLTAGLLSSNAFAQSSGEKVFYRYPATRTTFQLFLKKQHRQATLGRGGL